MGLHVRSEVEALSDVDKEHRVRLWWSLYSLEVLLNELTGRPSCISDRDISTPLPVNIDEKDFLLSRPLYEREGSTYSSSSRRGSKGKLGPWWKLIDADQLLHRTTGRNISNACWILASNRVLFPSCGSPCHFIHLLYIQDATLNYLSRNYHAALLRSNNQGKMARSSRHHKSN